MPRRAAVLVLVVVAASAGCVPYGYAHPRSPAFALANPVAPRPSGAPSMMLMWQMMWMRQTMLFHH
jgi:hypothetical protein